MLMVEVKLEGECDLKMAFDNDNFPEAKAGATDSTHTRLGAEGLSSGPEAHLLQLTYQHDEFIMETYKGAMFSGPRAGNLS